MYISSGSAIAVIVIYLILFRTCSVGYAKNMVLKRPSNNKLCFSVAFFILECLKRSFKSLVSHLWLLSSLTVFDSN